MKRAMTVQGPVGADRFSQSCAGFQSRSMGKLEKLDLLHEIGRMEAESMELGFAVSQEQLRGPSERGVNTYPWR